MPSTKRASAASAPAFFAPASAASSRVWGSVIRTGCPRRLRSSSVVSVAGRRGGGHRRRTLRRLVGTGGEIEFLFLEGDVEVQFAQRIHADQHGGLHALGDAL